MAEKKKVVAPGMLRDLNKQVQGGGVELPQTQEPQSHTQSQAEVTEKKPAVAEKEEPATFEGWLENYTGVKEQGQAIWVPSEVKKKLERIRVNASKNIPLRSLAAAMIMMYITEHEDEINKL